MSTSLALRRGLPRVPGGEPWPPAGVVEVDDRPDFLAETASSVPTTPAPAPSAPGPVTTPGPTAPQALQPVGERRRVPLRRGLPRTPQGEPWPAAGSGLLEVSGDVLDLSSAAVQATAPAAAATATPTVPAATQPARPTSQPVQTTTVAVALRRGLPRVPHGNAWPPAGEGRRVVAADPFSLDAPTGASSEQVSSAPAAAAPVVVAPAARAMGRTRQEKVALRRGLPREAGGEPWPPAGFGALTVLVDVPELDATPEVAAPEATPPAPVVETPPPSSPPPPASPPAPTRPAPSRVGSVAPVAPEPARTPVLVRAVELVRRFPAPAVVLAIAVVGGVMTLATWFAGTSAGTAFLTRFPGFYALPAGADPGFPAWVRWNHFLNLFFIVLIIRTGLTVHYEKKPPAYWTPRTAAFGGKISITAWLHQCLDLLWLLNGAVFIVLLFATDHWMRIVPTSWEVFPNAVSAALQYVTFDWPPEAGWTTYNSLQQLAYFTVVFVAAPLAAATGFRMSGLWPARAQRLSRLYPIELARAVHFPTMIFFVGFVIAHVSMVFLTGARQNLNHMYAGTDRVGWSGFWILVGGLAVLAVAWELLRPALLAPVANLMGRVSQR